MEALLSDINQAGLGRGLQFELFKPASAEIMSDFYAELPITDQTGWQLSRHRCLRQRRIAAFAHRHAEQSSASPLDKDGSLVMDATARTFRYLDEEEINAQRKAAREKADKAKQGK